jgi:RNA-directed DNA polymerase
MHGRVADRGVVPMMPTKETSRAEERPRQEGSSVMGRQVRTQSRSDLSDRLIRVHEAAKRSRQTRFTALLHHVNVDSLERAYRRLRRAAAPGIDGITVQSYAQDLQARLSNLCGRIHSGRYRPLPVRRTYIPKADGGRRPLGVPALEDKIVQGAVAEVLSAIYEADFLDCSFGFRPKRSAHQALRSVHDAVMTERVSWVLDADIRRFFDSVDHGWLMRMLEHRIADPRVLLLLRQWLAAGVLENGIYAETVEGTPQGSGISPLLANVFLHYALDLWVQQWSRREATGRLRLVRYADDFVLTFEMQGDAHRLRMALTERLAKFALQLHEDKTRLIEFGRFAAAARQRRHVGRPETFDFLGFTHFCGKSRKGRFLVQRQTQRTRVTRKLRTLRQEMKRRRHRPVREQHGWLAAVLRGHYAYYGVTGNYRRLNSFHYQVRRAWLAALRRRSQRPRLPWARFEKLLQVFPLPAPRIVHVWRTPPIASGLPS